MRLRAPNALILRHWSLGVNTIKCVHLVSPIGAGVPDAWKIMGDDGGHYLVKFRTNDNHTVLNEMLCGHLAGRFGLPSFGPALVAVDAGPIEQFNATRVEAGLDTAEPRAHFGIKFIEPFFTVRSLADIGIRLTAEMMDNLADVPDILGLDTMIQDNDRHDENVAVEPNALGGGPSRRVFDFGHAIGGAAWTAATLKETYEALAPVEEFSLITDLIAAPGDFERLLRAFESHLKEWLDEFLAVLPPGLGPDARADAKLLKSALVALRRSSLEEAILGAPALR